MPTDYSNAKIYKIEPIVEHEEHDVYYGSTCQTLEHRMKTHCENNNGFTTAQIVISQYGKDNCKIKLVEKCKVKNKDELHKRESYYVKNYPCVNMVVPYRSKKETKIIEQEYRDGRIDIKREYDRKYNEAKKHTKK